MSAAAGRPAAAAPTPQRRRRRRAARDRLYRWRGLPPYCCCCLPTAAARPSSLLAGQQAHPRHCYRHFRTSRRANRLRCPRCRCRSLTDEPRCCPCGAPKRRARRRSPAPCQAAEQADLPPSHPAVVAMQAAPQPTRGLCFGRRLPGRVTAAVVRPVAPGEGPVCGGRFCLPPLLHCQSCWVVSLPRPAQPAGICAWAPPLSRSTTAG